jgi:hypothetical protein
MNLNANMKSLSVAKAYNNILRRSSIADNEAINSISSRFRCIHLREQQNRSVHNRNNSYCKDYISINDMNMNMNMNKYQSMSTSSCAGITLQNIQGTIGTAFRSLSIDTSPDPSSLQYEFNQLLNDISPRAFDLSYQELQETFHQLDQIMQCMEDHSKTIILQHDYFYLQTIQKLMSRSANLGSIDGAELTEKYLTLVLNSNLRARSHIQHGGDDGIVLMPTREMYTLAMDAWAKLRDLKQTQDRHWNALLPAQRAQKILDFMWEKYHHHHSSKDSTIQHIKPDVIHYTTVLQALANASSKKATQRAQNLLKQAERRSGLQDFLSGKKSLSDVDPNLVPDRACYNTVLYCLSRYFQSRDDVHERPHSAQYIMGVMKEIMNKMEIMADKLNDDAWMPNTRTYNFLLMACSRRPNGGGKEAERILEGMLHKAHHLIDHDVGAVMLGDDQSLEDLEENMVVPNIKSYNNVINAWSHDRSGDGPERAEELLKALLRQVFTLEDNSVSGEISRHPLLNLIYPDVVTFNLVINAWTRSGRAEAGKRAERILNLLIDQSPQTIKAFMSNDELKVDFDELNVAPDVISFNSTINAWSKSDDRDSAQRSENVLHQLLTDYEKHGEVVPSAVSFCTAMQAWAKSSDPNRGSKTQDLFDKLICLHNEIDDDRLRPSESCYGALLSAYCADAEETGEEKIFEAAMESLVRMQREGGFIPNTSHYNLLLFVPSKMRDCDEAKRFNIALKARSILEEMTENTKRSPNSAPDIYSFNNIIKAFQGYDDEERKRESLFAVLDVFNMLCETNNCGPNDQTYIHLMKAVQESLIESKDRAILCEEIFRKCCESGLLTNAVLNIIGNLLPPVSLKRLEACRTASKTEPLTVYNLPLEWSENRRVGQNQRRNRKNR